MPFPRKARRAARLTPSRRPSPGVERLERRELLANDFASILGVGSATAATNPIVPYGVAIDSQGNRYVAGAYFGTVGLDPNATSTTTSAGFHDIFVAKYSPSGTLIWAHTAGSTGDDRGLAIAVNATGVYVTGEFSGTVNFSTSSTPANLSAPGRADVFVWKLDLNGNGVYASQAPGTTGNTDTAYSIAVDAAGSAVIGGSYQTGIDPTTKLLRTVAIRFGSTTLADAANYAPFVAKLDPAGNFVWARGVIGGANQFNEARAVTYDGSGNVYVTGQFSGTANFNPAGSDIHTSAGSSDAYVQELNVAGGFVFARTIGGAGGDQGFGIAVDGAGNIFDLGFYSGTANLNPFTVPAVNLTSPGTSGLYLVKIDASHASLDFAKDLGVAYTPSGENLGLGGIALDTAGNAYVTGSFTGTARIGTQTFTATGTSQSGFVAQLSNAGAILQAQQIGGAGISGGTTIAVNPAGIVAVAGSYTGSVTAGRFGLSSAAGNQNLFLATLGRPAVGSYSGDGRTDLAIYSPKNGIFIYAHPDGTGAQAIAFGGADPSFIPIPGDYFGEGRTSLAIYSPKNGIFEYAHPDGSNPQVVVFGGADPSFIPIPGDYFGEGKSSLGIYSPKNGLFEYAHPDGIGAQVVAFGGPDASFVPPQRPVSLIRQNPGTGIVRELTPHALAAAPSSSPVSAPIAAPPPAGIFSYATAFARARRPAQVV